jgi:hypothetical protein
MHGGRDAVAGDGREVIVKLEPVGSNQFQIRGTMNILGKIPDTASARGTLNRFDCAKILRLVISAGIVILSKWLFTHPAHPLTATPAELDGLRTEATLGILLPAFETLRRMATNGVSIPVPVYPPPPPPPAEPQK